MPLPKNGTATAEILAQLGALQARDVDWKSGRAFTLAYHAGDDVLELATAANAMYLSTNALNTEAFPSLRTMQSEVVAMMADLLHGGSEAAGFMTSGGTESILLAVKAARSRGRERGITAPEMVLPTTAHAAFEKAAYDFDVQSIRVPVRDDFRADPTAMATHVTSRTVLLVGSAPAYPQGVVDPIAEIARLAADAGVNCHVDACMGGITLPMLERLGYPIPPFDFRVPGVTSISVDLHKYGYTAKGASVLLHRNKELRKHQTFVTQNWLGGLYASSGILGTKSGGPIAAAWAVMKYLGEDGYLRLTKAARVATETLHEGLRRIPGVRVLAEPDATLVAFTFDDVDAFAVGNALAQRGWFVDQQQPPPSLHCTVNAVHAAVIGAFLSDLSAVVGEVRTAQTRARQTAYGALE
jgi:glutamate/tyrosine decarboxylase-like PLP-dependent enzyme